MKLLFCPCGKMYVHNDCMFQEFICKCVRSYIIIPEKYTVKKDKKKLAFMFKR